ncbi:MAG: dolichyl-phosphate mannose synthase [Lachnospiraceae bacterium]|nr:dolichyl-phosphate mannose synthase [Lachnospiraceae bacterium]
MNKKQKIHLIMPMGGGGTRFGNKGFSLPKPLIPLKERPFFFWAAQSLLKFIEVQDLTFVVLKDHVERFSIDREIRAYYKDARILVIPEVLNGAVLTCLEGIRDFTDDLPVFFNDCDHAFLCSPFYCFCENADFSSPDGALLTFTSDSPNFSYVRFDKNGRLVGTVEKVVASDQAICGAYFFKNSQIFRQFSERYLKNCSYSEYFVSGVYNEMAKEGLSLVNFPLELHISFGTPAEYDEALTNTQLGRLL